MVSRIDILIRFVETALKSLVALIALVSTITMIGVIILGDETSASDLLMFLLFDENPQGLTNIVFLRIVKTAYKLGTVIITTYFTGMLLTFFLAGRTSILMPENLVIRFRTSSGIEKDERLTIGALIGNAGRYIFYDTTCRLNCNYYDGTRHNAEYESEKKQFFLENYHRYDFPIIDFPIVFIKNLRAHLKGEGNKKDSLTVSIVGSSNALVDRSLIYHKYMLINVIPQAPETGIGIKEEDVRGILKIVNVFPGVKTKMVKSWKNFNYYKRLKCEEEEFQEIICELDRIILIKEKRADVKTDENLCAKRDYA